MRRAILLLCGGIILLVAAAHLYRDPRLRDLFRSSSGAAPAHKRQEGIAAAPAPLRKMPGKVAAPLRTGRIGPESDNRAPAAAARSPNELVSRVLMQALAAKKLAAGISLQVSDDAIEAFGEVPSAEDRAALLRLLEKGSEGRRVDASRLAVKD